VVEGGHVKDEPLVRQCVAVANSGFKRPMKWGTLVQGSSLKPLRSGGRGQESQRPAMRWPDELAAGGWLGVLAFVYTAGAARPASLG
jgi:hypothetical protein